MLVSFNYNKDTRFVVSEADKTVSPGYYVSQGNWLVDLSQQFETEEVKWMANEAVLKFPQNRCNRKVTHVFQQNTMIIKYPSDSNYHEIWINPLPCELVFKNFMPEFNSGSHETKKMSTRWFLKFDVKFCHTHQSRSCLWDIIGHQILLNVITAKQGKANFKRQFRIIPNAKNCSSLLFYIKLCPKKKEAPCRSGFFLMWYPCLWDPGVLKFSNLLRGPCSGPLPLLLMEETCPESHSLRHCSFLINLPFTEVFSIL